MRIVSMNFTDFGHVIKALAKLENSSVLSYDCKADILSNYDSMEHQFVIKPAFQSSFETLVRVAKEYQSILMMQELQAVLMLEDN